MCLKVRDTRILPPAPILFLGECHITWTVSWPPQQLGTYTGPAAFRATAHTVLILEPERRASVILAQRTARGIAAPRLENTSIMEDSLQPPYDIMQKRVQTWLKTRGPGAREGASRRCWGQWTRSLSPRVSWIVIQPPRSRRPAAPACSWCGRCAASRRWRR